jgi:hypothetical protein
MTTEPPTRTALLPAEATPTAATRIRIVIDDLIHLILRLQLATGTPMPGLSPSLALLTFPADQFLGLRARLRTPLRPRFRRIRRRWRRARTRILPRLLLKPPQPIIVLLNPASEIKNALHTRLAP